MFNVKDITGLVGLYTADSYEDKVWKDTSGKSNHTIKTNGNPIKKTGVLNGLSVIQGGVEDGFVFPTTILPSVYTLFHITKYNGDKKGRIVSSVSGDWLSGHWAGRSGIAYHESWLAAYEDHHQSNWVLSTDQNNLYRSNNVERGKAGKGVSANLVINNGMAYSQDVSSFQIAEVIVYNRHLTAEEIKKVEGHLAHKYGLSFKSGYPLPAVAPEKEPKIAVEPKVVEPKVVEPEVVKPKKVVTKELNLPIIIATSAAVIIFLMILMYMFGGSKTPMQRLPQQFVQYPQQMMRGGGKKVKSFMKQLKSFFK